jgi:hypothetical protein
MADFDGDGRIDANDLALLEAAEPSRDLNGDGSVDEADREIFLAYYDPEPPMPDTLEACWDFDEEVNDIAYDGSAFGRHGQIIGAMRVAGGGLEFDGRDDHVQIKGYPGVITTGARTVTAWIKTHATGQAIFSWGMNEPGGKWALSLTRGSRTEQAGALHLDVNGGSVKGKTSINDGQWHHIAVTFPGGEGAMVRDIGLYVDGQAEGIGRVVDGPVSTVAGADVTLGGDLEGPRSFFAGSLDDVCICSRVLTAEEIATSASAALIE